MMHLSVQALSYCLFLLIYVFLGTVICESVERIGLLNLLFSTLKVSRTTSTFYKYWAGYETASEIFSSRFISSAD